MCKYEKEREDAKKTVVNQILKEEGKLADKSQNKLPYTKLLEPLVRYTVEKNKAAVKDLQDGGTGERPKIHLKS